jgi:hypothetical protein
MRKRSAAFGFAIAFGLVGAAEAAAYKGVDLGGVNLNYYCSTTFGAGYKSVLIGSTAGDWRCSRGGKSKDVKSISVDAACRLQYGNPLAKAKALNWSDALSWRCFAPRQ